MDLDRVPGVTPESKDALARVGLTTVADLARASDAEALAERTGLPLHRIEGLREAARAHILHVLRDAGIANEAELAGADPAQLAERTGIAQADVEWFQGAAHEAISGLPASRVVLHQATGIVHVRLDGGTLLEAPLHWTEPAPEAGDVVLVKPGADEATARVRGTTHEALPIYAERDGAEVRVRLRDVRVGEPGKEKKRGLFGRGKDRRLR